MNFTDLAGKGLDVLLDNIAGGATPVEVLRDGEPVAVIISLRDWEELQAVRGKP